MKGKEKQMSNKLLERIKRIITQFTLVCFLSQTLLFALPAQVQAAQTTPAAPKDELIQTADGRQEVTNKRTQFSKTFLNKNGTKTLEVHQEPIHYKKPDGKFEDIKTDLQQKVGISTLIGGAPYVNSQNTFEAQFSQSAADTIQSFKVGSSEISFKLADIYRKAKLRILT